MSLFNRMEQWNGMMEWNDHAHITMQFCTQWTSSSLSILRICNRSARKILTKALQKGRQSIVSSFVHESRLCGLMDQKSIDWKRDVIAILPNTCVGELVVRSNKAVLKI